MPTKTRDKRRPHSNVWSMRDAKARFDEVVRYAQSEGPQRITIDGENTIVVLSAHDYDKIASSAHTRSEVRTGADLIPIMQKAGRLGLKLRPARVPALIRRPIDFSVDEATNNGGRRLPNK